MDEKPEALLLAKWLDDKALTWGVNRYRKVAAELRRLHEVNAEMLEALDEIAINTHDDTAERVARVAIAKAEGK